MYQIYKDLPRESCLWIEMAFSILEYVFPTHWDTTFGWGLRFCMLTRQQMATFPDLIQVLLWLTGLPGREFKKCLYTWGFERWLTCPFLFPAVVSVSYHLNSSGVLEKTAPGFKTLQDLEEPVLFGIRIQSRHNNPHRFSMAAFPMGPPRWPGLTSRRGDSLLASTKGTEPTTEPHSWITCKLKGKFTVLPFLTCSVMLATIASHCFYLIHVVIFPMVNFSVPDFQLLGCFLI